MRMKKRGILLGNVTNIIIAVLGLMVFGFFVIQIYKLYTNQESENAKNVLETLSAKIEVLKVGEGNEILIQGFEGGEKWVLVGWSRNEGKQEGKPDKCFGKSCLCACQSTDQLRKDIGLSCQNSGTCKFFDANSMSAKTLLEQQSKDYIKVGKNILGISVKREVESISLEVIGESIPYVPTIAPVG